MPENKIIICDFCNYNHNLDNDKHIIVNSKNGIYYFNCSACGHKIIVDKE